MKYPHHLVRQLAAPTLIAALLCPALPACQTRQAPPPPVDDSRGNGNSAPGAAAPAAQGMSTKSKVVMLAGAAALYYMYKRHQSSAAAAGAEGQYYLSKNGRVYYRDADHRAHWVTPPANGIEVPESEAAQYRSFQGYDNSTSGRDLAGLGSDATE